MVKWTFLPDTRAVLYLVRGDSGSSHDCNNNSVYCDLCLALSAFSNNSLLKTNYIASKDELAS